MDLGSLRRDYRSSALSEDSVDPDPVAQFRLWFEEARSAGLIEPNAMSLATVDADHRPDLRTVLLKAFDQEGFVFFTNFTSAKAKQIEGQPEVALLFPWLALERQVKILGRASRLPAKAALAYFLSRPRGSRLGAWVSDQSQVISGRKWLEMKWEEVKRKFGEGEIPLPDHWGGFRIQPHAFEFWQGRENRLHDRIRYRLTEPHQTDGVWVRERLAP